MLPVIAYGMKSQIKLLRRSLKGCDPSADDLRIPVVIYRGPPLYKDLAVFCDKRGILLIIIEAIRRKKMKPEIENGINLVGFALLMLLMVVVMYNDILKLM